MTPKPEWVSISAYAIIHGVHRKTVHKWLDSGLLETFRVGRCIRIRCLTPEVVKSHSLRNTKARGKIDPHKP